MLSAGLLIVIVSSGKEGVKAGALSCPPTISVPGRGLCSKKVVKIGLSRIFLINANFCINRLFMPAFFN